MRLADRLQRQFDAGAGRPVPFADDMHTDRQGAATEIGIAAAVLIAVTDRPEPGLILTQRPETMRRHPGQIAFPGGRTDPGDADAIATALREAHEEVALPPSAVRVIGMLDPYATVTGFTIVPVLAVVAPDLPLVPCDREVAAVFEVPLAFVLDPGNAIERRAMFGGHERRYREILWQDRRIWGATAAMLANLAARLA